MNRIAGYIDVNELLGIEKQDIYQVDEQLRYLLKHVDSVIVHKKRMNSQFVFSFTYNGERYYFKYDSLSNPYNELIAYYIAQDLGVANLKYDLATLGVYEGVISKDFKEPGAKYVLGSDILKEVYGDEALLKNNSLEKIWLALEEYFKDAYNIQGMIPKIMEQIVRLFLLDIFLGQEDRHPDNWGIVVKSDGNIELQVVYDNLRMLLDYPAFVNTRLQVADVKMGLEEVLEQFLDISSSEFSRMLADYLWVIDEENIKKILDRIEKQTMQAIPDEMKKDYLNKFEIYYGYFESFIREYNGAR